MKQYKMNVLKLVKGGQIWVDVKEKENTWIQCQCCGNIYQVNRKISISVSIVHMECPKCGEYSGLNCGSDENDLYYFMNPNVDERYYNY